MAVAFVKAHTVVTEKTLDTTASVQVDTGGIAAGNLIVLAIEFDNAGTASKPVISSISKMAGESASWVSLGAARSTSTSIGAFASGELWAIRTTVAWAAGTYTVTLDTAVTQKAAAFLEFSGVEAALRGTAGTAYSTTTTAASAASGSPFPVIGDLALGFLFGSNIATIPASDTDTTGGSWSTAVGIGSTGGSAATNNFGAFQYKVVTAASQQTYNSSAAGAAGNGAIVAILQQYAPTITQAAYRLYADGTETGATALAAQDTAATADLTSGDANLSVRLRLQSTYANAIDATEDWQLQWKNGGAEYDLSNADTTSQLNSGRIQIAQSFMGAGGPLTTVDFMLSKGNTPTGTVSAAVWAHDGGTFGGTGLPTGTPLATSTNSVTASTLTTTQTRTTFTFAGTVTPTAGTPYYVGLIATGAAASPNGVNVGLDLTSPTAPGRLADYFSAWATAGVSDMVFEIGTWANVGTGTATVAGYNSANLTDGAATTNRLGSGTGSFVAGEISETGLVTDLGWSASNFTELLYSVTLKQADLANSDTLRFRVLRNGATTGLTYTQTPTINVTVGAGVPNGAGSGTYLFARTTVTGYVDKRGTSTAGTYAWNRTAVTGTKLTKGTAVGAYAWDRTTAVGVAPVLPKTGTAAGSYAFDKTAATGTKTPRGTATTGTYLWARTTATGVVEKRATTTGTYLWARTTATGTKTPRGTTTGGTYTWTGNAQGLAPAVGVHAGTAIGAYLWARTTVAGTKDTRGTAAGTYLWAGTAAGKSPQRGTSTGAYAWDRTAATGRRDSRATAGGNYTFARTSATGTTAPRGATTGTYAYTGTATGTKTQRATAAGTYAFNRTTVTGTKAPRGTTSGTYLWARTTVTGSRTPKATTSGAYAFNRTTVTGYSLPKAQSTTGTWNWSGNGQGIRPVLGQKQGTALGAYAFNRTAAVGDAPVVPTRAGTAAGTYLWARTTGTGARPSVATSVGGFAWNRTTATGKRTPKASSSGTYLYTGTGTGFRPIIGAKTGTAAGAYAYAGTSAGTMPQAAGYVEDFAGHPAQVWAGGHRYPIQTFDT